MQGVNSYLIHAYHDERKAIKNEIYWRYEVPVYQWLYDIKMPVPKIWAHRCDSIEKMQENMDKFAGVELDLNYFADQGEFDVSHDKQAELDYPLESFLQQLAASDAKMWLDFKNLTADNRLAAMNRLEYLFAKYNIDKSRAIVESHNVKELALFHQAGWYTSFYVSVNDRFLNTAAGREEFLDEVAAAVATGNIDAVSFPIEYYELVKSGNFDIDLLTWDIDARWGDYIVQRQRRNRLADDRLKVVLVTSDSKYTR